MAQNRKVDPDGDDLVWVRVGEAIERLRLLTGESESTIQRRYAADVYPTRTDEETRYKLVGIPADAPPTLEVQFAQARCENRLLREELETQKQRAGNLEGEVVSSRATIADLSGKADDEILYREYLTDNLRQQGEDRAEKEQRIDKLQLVLRKASLACWVIALVVFLVTATAVALAVWVFIG